MSYRTTTAVVAVLAIGAILWLIRKDHLHPRKAIFWIFSCAAIGLLGFFPSIADWIAGLLGVAYSPSLFLTLGIVVLLIKLLQLDIARTHEHQLIVILAQRLSILEMRIENLTVATGKPNDREDANAGK